MCCCFVVLLCRIVSQAELRTALVQHLTQSISAQVTDRITGMLLSELQQRIVPLIVSRLDQVKQTLQSEVAHRLAICDQVLLDNITKLSNSKATMEAFGNAVMLAVQATLQKTYADTMKDTLVPAYERASGEMFRQVQEVFLNGTKACKCLRCC